MASRRSDLDLYSRSENCVVLWEKGGRESVRGLHDKTQEEKEDARLDMRLWRIPLMILRASRHPRLHRLRSGTHPQWRMM